MALVVAVPVAFDLGGYFTFLPAKWTLASVLAAGGIATLIAQGRPLARSAPVLAWVALLVVLAAASLGGVGGLTSWIGYPGRSLGVLAWVTFFAAFVLGASTLVANDRRRVVRALSAGSLVVSGYAVLQATGLDPLEWSAEIDVSRSRSTLGNAAFLGAYLVLVVPVATRLALDPHESREARAMHAAAAAAASVALMTTQTRAAWLGAVGGLLVVAAMEHRRARARPRRTAAVAAAAVAALAMLATVSPYADRIRSIADPSTPTGQGRLTQWDRTTHLVAARPVLGWGPETYAFTFPTFIDRDFERTVGRTVVPDRAHNVLLDVAASAGVVGAAAYLAVLALLAGAVARKRDRDALTVGLVGSCVAYLVQLQLSFPVADVDTVFWLLAGLLLASTAPARRVVRRQWAAVPAVLAAVLAVAGAIEVAADRDLRRALDAEAARSFADAERWADRAARLCPWRAQYGDAAARLYLRIGEVTGRPQDFERGLALVERTHRLVPRDLELATNRADLLLSWGQVAGDPARVGRAASAYEDVLDRDPFSSRLHLKLGVAYVLLAREVDAEREWRTAADLAPRATGPLVDLGRLYVQQHRDDEARNVLAEALRLEPDNATARELLSRLRS